MLEIESFEPEDKYLASDPDDWDDEGDSELEDDEGEDIDEMTVAGDSSDTVSPSSDNLVDKRRREAELIYGSEEDVSGSMAKDWIRLTEQPDYYTVTKMTAGVRDPNRVNIFLDGHFAFSLDVTQTVDFGLKVGQHITPKKLEKLKRASEFGKLYQRTLEWVVSRPHSVRETRDYLRRRQIKRKILNRQRIKEDKKPLAEIEDDIMDLVLERLVEKRFLDDRKFAEFYVENRYVRKGISQKRLRMELSQKGVDREVAAAAMQKIPRDENEEMAKMIAKKHKKYPDDFRLIGYLVRQGFNFQAAKDAVAAWHESEETTDV